MTLDATALFWAMHALNVDRVSAEITERLEAEDIEVLLVKGPVIGAWLYPGEVRPYGDSDLVVRQCDWARAVALLQSLGFRDFLGPLEHPRMESHAGTGFLRGGDNVDLHSTLPGLDADPERVWSALFDSSEGMDIGGRRIRVPARPAILLHVALHAVHHVDGKPIADLHRALAIATDDEWRAAASLANGLNGLPAFASGLRLAPDGERLVTRLGLGHAGSVHFDLRTAQVPLAEGLDKLLAADVTLRERATIIARELVPNPEFMRWWSPLARRGRRGLVASYPWRWAWLLAKAPAAFTTRRRIRRARG